MYYVSSGFSRKRFDFVLILVLGIFVIGPK